MSVFLKAWRFGVAVLRGTDAKLGIFGIQAHLFEVGTTIAGGDTFTVAAAC